MTSSEHDEHYELRAGLRAALRADLLGPLNGTQEILSNDAPVTAYPIGVLFPQAGGKDRHRAVDDLLDDMHPDIVRQDDQEQGIADLGITLANRRKPSTMGLTLAVDLQVADTLFVEVTAATYQPRDEAGRRIEPRRSEARTTEQQKERWHRIPVGSGQISVDLQANGMSEPQAVCEGLQLRTLVRPPALDGTKTVTITLVNIHETSEYDLQDAYCFFQPELTICGPPGTRPFVERQAALGAVDDEQALSRLLHRHAPYFASGHGCSVAWEWMPAAIRTPLLPRAAVSRLRTEFIPTHEVLLTDSNPEIDDAALAMLSLAQAPQEVVVSSLERLLAGYEQWIADRTEDASELVDEELVEAAARQLATCRNAHARMRRGVALLDDRKQPEIFAAFALANEAMAQQRAQASWIKAGREGTPDPRGGRWRPFQIAFMLLCLEGIVDAEHEDRELADLLWFPTGGGKTEAYLGLIAFTTFLRRLRNGEAGEGVTVLMRYTLRLLTLQQFERATALICAMETMRRRPAAGLGSAPISIGMWVGSSATPNKLSRAEEQLAALRAYPHKSLQRENPVQLHQCPWCGTSLDSTDYQVDRPATRMYLRCPDSHCDFHLDDGLPVHLVDEAIYAAHPTLVIATVDKFASMPWRPETRALFNRDLQGIKQPELIVQDELHLISGPLGTLTGLYETAVDVLANGPKVVASTATIRRASDQVRALFDRRVAQFPPAGLDSRDSWFAVEAPRTEKASRRYVGLLTPSTSQATLLIRTYAALLHAADEGDVPDEIRDAYWTLVGYFNSLRLLSAAELQVRDDVQDRLEMLASQGRGRLRKPTTIIELSSRATSSDIPRYLKELDRSKPDKEVVDVLLATNMISVGVDIDRLGLMAVMGQPQTTAEYIQATSRVGRRHPGLIAVMLNSARSRDRSHYESFPAFHSALYRDVESTSVTPFSARARDRGLHAVIVALTRLMIPAAASDAAAADIDDFVHQINSTVRPRLLERVASVDHPESAQTAEEFDNFIELWQEAALSNPTLRYEAKRGSSTPALLDGFDAAEQAENFTAWPTLWSLRDVDAESTLFLEHNRQER